MDLHTHSRRFPPRNRVPTGVHALQVELVDATGRWTLDLKRAAVAAYTARLPVSQPCYPSDLTGAPGYLFRNGDGVEVALTGNELLRLLRRELLPGEVLALHEKFGAFFETHASFYDEVTGEALCAMGNLPGSGPLPEPTQFSGTFTPGSSPRALQ